MKPLIIYHASCADGFGAAYAAWTVHKDEAEYLPMQYGTINTVDDLDLLGGIEGREVFILDFSFSRPITDAIIEQASFTTWLDHHKTAFEMWAPEHELHENSQIVSKSAKHCVVLKNNMSGAMIAWEFFVGHSMPMMIRHIDDYDRWQFRFPDTKAFSKALWSTQPWTLEGWNELHMSFTDDTFYERFVEKGYTLLKEHDNQVERAVFKPCKCCIDGAHGLAVNASPALSSDAGHKLARESSTYGVVYHIDDKLRVKFSLRSTGDYDVSAIAKKFGGGGHKNAAGFEGTLADLMKVMEPDV